MVCGLGFGVWQKMDSDIGNWAAIVVFIGHPTVDSKNAI